MERNEQLINLEAFLDGELSGQDAAAFSTALAADPQLQAEVETRRRERREYRLALGEDLPAPDLAAWVSHARKPGRSSHRDKRLSFSRIGFALAASICLVILMPGVLRNDKGAKGPRSIISTSGQVAVIRYGEHPGETAVLETGAIDLPAELSR